MARRASPQVYRIASPDLGVPADLAQRQRRYLISMSVRTVCFLAAVFTPPPWRWALVVAAVFLPYVAVVMANARRTERQAPTFVARPTHTALGPTSRD